MKNTRRFCLAVAAVAGVSLAGPALAGAADAAPADGNIAVVQVRKGKLADPAGAAWKSVPQTRMEVTTAFAGHPSIVGDATATEVNAQAARAGDELFIRLQWKDSSENRQRGIGKFADGVAVQFPTDGSKETQPFMGGEGKRVNIWHWSASKNAGENLVANGFGSLTRLPVQDVKASGHYANGTWTVVFHRPVKPQGDDNVPLANTSGANMPVAFAVWNGSNTERDGFKAVTLEWQGLKF
ncbi:MAG: DMSO reductase family type II enzyme, heme b subunit [Stygiobacter sp.]|nr:MAG: DMSO reductase family type II enzyme, heme b subunit [Stygiobacter sp.]